MSPHTDPGALMKLADELDECSFKPNVNSRFVGARDLMKRAAVALRQAASQGREGGEESGDSDRQDLIARLSEVGLFGGISWSEAEQLCKQAAAELSRDPAQAPINRGRHYDIIAEALEAYDEWMKDDDYNSTTALNKIMRHPRSPPRRWEARANDASSNP